MTVAITFHNDDVSSQWRDRPRMRLWILLHQLLHPLLHLGVILFSVLHIKKSYNQTLNCQLKDKAAVYDCH
jgi:hypothetical protein